MSRWRLSPRSGFGAHTQTTVVNNLAFLFEKQADGGNGEAERVAEIEPVISLAQIWHFGTETAHESVTFHVETALKICEKFGRIGKFLNGFKGLLGGFAFDRLAVKTLIISVAQVGEGVETPVF